MKGEVGTGGDGKRGEEVQGEQSNEVIKRKGRK